MAAAAVGVAAEHAQTGEAAVAAEEAAGATIARAMRPFVAGAVVAKEQYQRVYQTYRYSELVKSESPSTAAASDVTQTREPQAQ